MKWVWVMMLFLIFLSCKSKKPVIGTIGLGEIEISGKLESTKTDSTFKRVKKKRFSIEWKFVRKPD